MDSLFLPALEDPIVFDTVLDVPNLNSMKAAKKSKFSCDYPGCTIRSRQYGCIKDSKRYCTYHGVAMKLRRISSTVICRVKGCNRTAYVTVNGIRKYCKEHRIPDDKYSIYHRTCDVEGCIKYPLFKDKSGMKYCSGHRIDGCTPMYLYRYCKEEGCTKSSSYGYNGANPEYCATHGKLREGYSPTYRRANRKKKSKKRR